ncbi:hypothetical protein F2Q69_00029079 [Brassica cretica]|uniref:Uncharacterized protein n=1 Tax=Brassica cretica TaxID=69181 RepID=A0A8S9S949_BRACR|nr:hypothetical protein F2Q69_00029079 [Brassica cretica]
MPFPRGMVEKSIFLSKNGFVLYSSFLLAIFIILLYMQGCSVHCHAGIVVVILPIAWTTVDRFFLMNVDRFLIGTIDRCCGVLPIGALSTFIGYAASSECALVVSGGLAEGLGCGMSALRRATSIFGICTRSPFSSRTRIKVATMSCSSVSIDVRTEVSIDVGWKISSMEECLQSTVVSEYRSTIQVSGSMVVDEN